LKTKDLTLALGVGLLSGSVLMLELLLTRLFSVALYYHFAFMAVSVALLGLGAGGLLVYLNRQRFTEVEFPRHLNRLGLLLVVAMVMVLALILNTRLPTQVRLGTAVRLSGVFAISSLPFLFAGAMLSLIIWRFAGQIHRVYFFDLVGAALGSLSILPALQWIGAPNATLLAAVCAAAGTLLLCISTGAARPVVLRAGLLFAAAGMMLGVNLNANLLDLRYAKGVSTDEEHYSRWNAISRICVHPGEDPDLSIRIDCDAATGISQHDFWNGDRAALKERFSRTGDDLPHVLRPRARTLVIGAGGGVDVARALAHGSPRVVAVEINPLIAEKLMLGKYREHSFRLYERPEVELIVDDARSAVQRAAEKFDVMQATGIDTWASTAAGAFALTESYLYTVEAFQNYLEHLSPEGILTVSRWEFEPPRQALRIVSLGRAALERLGAAEPGRHVVVVKNPRGDMAVLIKRSPFTGQELGTVREFIAARPGLAPVYLPDAPGASAFSAMMSAPSLADFAREYPYEVSPTSDAKPFFFFTARWGRLMQLFRNPAEDLKNNLALFVLAVLTVITLVSVLALMSLPKWFAAAAAASVSAARWFYFLSIGVAYIIVEISLIQTFVLLMGHPTYGITVVVFSLLVGSGLGSRWSGRIQSVHRAGVVVPLLLAVSLSMICLFVLPGILQGTQPLSRLARGLISVAVIFPMGFVMGIPFPSGVRAANEREGDVLPWLWSANAAGSVMGSVLAIVLALQFGIPWAGALGGLCYLFAALAGYQAMKGSGIRMATAT